MHNKLAALLLPLVALAAAAAEPRGITDEASTCATAADCQLLGQCVGGKCVCAPGFSGAACGQLDLKPAASLQAATLWPADGAANSSAWGFTTACGRDPPMPHAYLCWLCWVTIVLVISRQ
jgi:hypothetical protein